MVLSARRNAAFLALLLAACLLALPAFGGEVTQERVSLQLKDAPFVDVCKIFQRLLHAELEIEPGIDATVTIGFEDITVKTALSAICESAGCTWEYIEGDPGILRITRDPNAPARDKSGPEPGEGARTMRKEIHMDMQAEGSGGPGEVDIDTHISLKLVNADAEDVLQNLAQVLGCRILMDRNIAGKTVSIHEENKPLDFFLDAICKEIGASWKWGEGMPPTLEVSLN